MLIRILMFATLAVSGFAQKAAAPVTVPKAAVELSPGLYRYVDESGKPWTYRKTPFGVVKVAGEPKAQASPRPVTERQETPFGEAKNSNAHKDMTRVVEDGDTLRFERPSPFGSYKWSKKKSELNASEKEAWERERTGTGTKP